MINNGHVNACFTAFSYFVFDPYRKPCSQSIKNVFLEWRSSSRTPWSSRRSSKYNHCYAWSKALYCCGGQTDKYNKSPDHSSSVILASEALISQSVELTESSGLVKTRRLPDSQTVASLIHSRTHKIIDMQNGLRSSVAVSKWSDLLIGVSLSHPLLLIRQFVILSSPERRSVTGLAGIHPPKWTLNVVT